MESSFLTEDFKQNKITLQKQLKRVHKKNNDASKKATHVFLHERLLTEIPQPKNPTQTIFAYYHNNNISKIENLENMYNLTHLHLQWNKINKIEGLERLYKLKKLYLGNNCISVIENLEALKHLAELHVEKQNIDNSEILCFEPRTTLAIGTSIRILNVSENKITDLSWAKPFRRLEVLIAKKNNLEDYQACADNLCTLVCLVDVNFIGNPMTKKHRYKETIVARCSQLRVLDTVTIHSTSKAFYQGLDKAVRLRQLHERNKINMNRQGLEDFFDLHMLPGVKALSATTLPQLKPQLPKARPVDSLYTMMPRTLLRMTDKRLHTEEGPIKDSVPPVETISTTLPIKGILKKPMPMKYI